MIQKQKLQHFCYQDYECKRDSANSSLVLGFDLLITNSMCPHELLCKIVIVFKDLFNNLDYFPVRL